MFKAMATQLNIPNEVTRILQSYRFSLIDEKRLQEEISKVLGEEGIAHRREVKLSPTDIIDFMFEDGTGLEIKIKAQKMAVYRQLRRYAGSDQVSSLILATAMSMGLPDSLEGKSAKVVSLGRSHL